MPEPSQSLRTEAYRARREGRLQEALSLYQESAALDSDMSHPLRWAHTTRHIADVERDMGANNEAKRHYEAALTEYRRHADTPALDLANTVRGYALLNETMGEHPSAKTLWTEALTLYAAVNVSAGVTEAQQHLDTL